MDIPAVDPLTRSVPMLLSRRTLTGLLGLWALALPGLTAAKTKAVRKTFANEGTGFKSKARISDVNLTLHGLSHGFAHDLFILLVAPGGRNAVVMGEAGINGPESAMDDLTLTLDDEADEALPVDEPFTSGAFRPLNNAEFDLQPIFPAPAPTPSDEVALSTFDGLNPNGEWQLFIVDHGGGDVGSLVDGWSLEITAKHKIKRKRKKRH
jgi:subtilisin-like proprotein convertase family protein